MKIKQKIWLLTAVFSLMLFLFPGQRADLIQMPQAMAKELKTIDWGDLVPPKGTGKKLDIKALDKPLGVPAREDFNGPDEEYEAMLEVLKDQRMAQAMDAFVNPKLDGKQVRIAGYITPLTFDGELVVEFLFVPYVGACIHVPPPPPNQIIHVIKGQGLNMEKIWDPVWITGQLDIKGQDTVLAQTGYQMKFAKVTPYTKEDAEKQKLEGVRQHDGSSLAPEFNNLDDIPPPNVKEDEEGQNTLSDKDKGITGD